MQKRDITKLCSTWFCARRAGGSPAAMKKRRWREKHKFSNAQQRDEERNSLSLSFFANSISSGTSCLSSFPVEQRRKKIYLRVFCSIILLRFVAAAAAAAFAANDLQVPPVASTVCSVCVQHSSQK